MIGQLMAAITEMARAAAVKAVAVAAIFLLFLVGTGFLIAAAYMALAVKFGAVAAALTVGLVLMAVGLLVAAIWFGPSASATVPAQKPKVKDLREIEDQMILDLLIDTATAGYMTGRGDKPAMNASLTRIMDDLAAIGALGRDRRARKAQTPDDPETKTADH